MNEEKVVKISHYELLVIISNEFTEDEVKAVYEKMYALIKSNGGEITFKEEWGKKKLAYAINHFSHGYYLLVEFDMDASKVGNVNKTLQMSRDVLRHQIVAKKKRTEAEIKAEKMVEEKMVEKKIAEESKAEEASKEKEKETKKMNLQDLDAKLDKILDTDDLL